MYRYYTFYLRRRGLSILLSHNEDSSQGVLTFWTLILSFWKFFTLPSLIIGFTQLKQALSQISMEEATVDAHTSDIHF